MPADEPGWWYAPDDARARLLAPVARIWGRAAEARFARSRPYRSRLPVICVGNFTAGGTGKTPVSLHIARLLAEAGETPVFLTRGYGGRIAGPAWLDPGRHTARDVGDEPLLLAGAFPVMVSRDRAAGARLIETSLPPGAGPEAVRPASVIVMDDGLQNPALAKDFSIALVDGARGVGNGCVMPAGPLRAPLEFQLGLVDAVMVMGGAAGAAETPGGGESGQAPAQAAGPAVLQSLRLNFPGPVLSARQEADGDTDTDWLAGARVLAWAGIGNPQRFFSLLARLGADVADTVAFRDHHALSEQDARNLLARAGELGATLVTTEKDMARIGGMRVGAQSSKDASMGGSPLPRGEGMASSDGPPSPPHHHPLPVKGRGTTGTASAVTRLAAVSRTLPIRVAMPAADAARLADLVRTAAETGGYRRGLKAR